MGWSYTHGKDKAGIIQELLTGFTRYAPIAHSCVGNNLWIVHERNTDADPSLDHRVLSLCLLASSRDGWGYKDMSESMGPYESDCPLKFLDMVPDPGGYATAFRERVRVFHAAKTQKRKAMKALAVGQRVQMIPGCSVESLTLASLKPLIGYDETGKRYRIQPRHIQPQVTA